MLQQQQPMTMPGMAAPAQVATAPVAQAAMGAAVAAGTPATTAPEVVQQPLPAGFNLAAFCVAKEKSTGTPRKKALAECTIEELRERVTFRDVQGPNKDGVNYHMRPCLHPKTLDIHAATGFTDPASGEAVNTCIVPLAQKDAIEDYFRQLVAAGYFDAELERARTEKVADDIAKEAEAKKAPVNTAAADNALAELQAAPVQAMGAPVGQVMQAAPVAAAPVAAAPVQQAMPTGMQAAAPTAMPGMPTMPGMPGM